MKRNLLFTVLTVILFAVFSNGLLGVKVQANELSVQDVDFIGKLDGEVEASEGRLLESKKSIKPLNVKVLEPSSETDVNLEEAYSYINEKGEDVLVTTVKISQEDRGKSFDILINSETNEYEVTESVSANPSDVSVQAVNTNYFMGATYTTLDPVLVALNRSRHELNWGGNANDAWKISRNATAWAANPSSLGTHWYVNENKYEGHVDGGKYINSSSYHSYYNYDFGSDSQRTDVWHRVNIRGYNDGYAYVTTERGKSGEGSSLLSFKLQTY
jgi:hypothetical protein